MSRKLRHRIFAECWIPIAPLGDDWILRVVSCLPEACRPVFFSRSERLDKRRAQLVADHAALREQTRKYSGASLHGDGSYIDAAARGNEYGRIAGYFGPVKAWTEVVPAWWRELDALGLIYAMASTEEEDEHRHSLTVQLAGQPGGHLLMRVGSDYTRYVPGLTWLNYFSKGYARGRGLEAQAVAAKAQGTLEELPNGCILKLYDSPDDWTAHRDRIDSLLESDPTFFSKRRVKVPEAVDKTGYLGLIATARRDWP